MTDKLSDLIENVVESTETDQEEVVGKIVSTQEPDEIALLLESLPIDQRLDAWNHIAAGERLAILVEMRGDPRESLLDRMSMEDLDALFANIDAEQLIELSESLPERLIDRALRAMDEQQRHYFEGAQQYADDEAGHWANHQILLLPPNAKVRDAFRLLRRELPPHTDTILLVNRAGYFSAAVKVGELLGAPNHIPLFDLAEEDIPLLKVVDDANDAALKVQKSGYSALPVVTEEGKLFGRMDIVTACELVNENYERQLMATAGMDEDEDLFAPIRKSARNRAVWLGINLLTALLASWFIGLFEATLEQVVALAVLMPVVASMGGIAGSQTLTLIIRGLALGQVTGANRNALMKKELSVGGLNGVIWSIVIGIVASLWFSNPMIGVVIGLAIIVNILAAAISGVGIPILLDRLNIDPALSGSVILTTVTDIVGFVAFLGLGSLLLI